MDAATRGALQTGKPVGGLKIGKEAGEWAATSFHQYLPPQSYLTCRYSVNLRLCLVTKHIFCLTYFSENRFFSARKHGLVDAAMRKSPADKTAVIALPGGVGTLDEVFEILALIQLERIGSELPVPVLMMNYDSFYSKLLDFFEDCEDRGTVLKGEVASLVRVCDNNSEALAYLGEFYDFPR